MGRIGHTWKLHEDLILAGTAVFLDIDLADAKLVNTIANGLDGLIDGLCSVCLLLSRLEADGVGVGYFSGCRDQIPLGETLSECSPKFTVLVGINADNLECIGLRAGDLAEHDISFVQLLSQAIDRLIGLRPDCVVGDDLKHHVDATPEIQAQLDIVLKSLFTRDKSRIRCDSPDTQESYA